MSKENRDAKIQNILANPVYVDEIYPNYAALCSHFGITAARGKERNYQKRLFNCFFDFVKMADGTNQIVILDTFFDDPKPYTDERTGIKSTEFNTPMQNLLLSHKWKTYTLLLSREILECLQLVPPHYSEEEKTIAQTDFVRKMTGTLESAVRQLQLKEEQQLQDSISIINVIGTRDKENNLQYELDEEGKAQYHEIVNSVLHEKGFNSKFEVYQHGAQYTFWKMVKERVCNEMKIENPIFEGYVFTKSEAQLQCDIVSERNVLCKLTASRLCENHATSYAQKNGKKIPAGGIGVKPCRILPPKKYQEDMEVMLKLISPELSV